MQAESIRLLHQVSHQSSTGSNTVLHIDNRLDGEELAELKNKEQLETFIDRTNPQEIVYKNRIQINKFGYISKMVNSRNRINEKIIFLHVSNTEEICDLVHSFLD